jgi:hypothetical protein
VERSKFAPRQTDSQYQVGQPFVNNQSSSLPGESQMKAQQVFVNQVKALGAASLRRMVSHPAVKRAVKKVVTPLSAWSIGIYTGTSPDRVTPPAALKNPVLTAQDVTDVPASFVADPFMMPTPDGWYMFLEIMNTDTNLGEIGYATSPDGWQWTYQQVILREPFHLSYPYVFKWQDKYYLIPETAECQSVRLYQAVNFPTQWVLVKTLLDNGDYADPSIFYYHDRWWLFVATGATRNTLRLYHASDLMGDWIEHPQSPLITGNTRSVRPAGRVIVTDQKIIRFAQDCESVYGRQVYAFEITKLTTTDYAEQAVSEHPIIQASGKGWNADGMHTIDAHPIDSENWIACVDGKKHRLVLGAGFNRRTP